jgi:hypothetical protein
MHTKNIHVKVKNSFHLENVFGLELGVMTLRAIINWKMLI